MFVTLVLYTRPVNCFLRMSGLYCLTFLNSFAGGSCRLFYPPTQGIDLRTFTFVLRYRNMHFTDVVIIFMHIVQ